jgi:diguanylate cyclase (GGDEF)-like protein
MFIELINGPMLFEHEATPAEYSAGLKFAIVLRLFARETEALVARHGGEEFAALMAGATQEQAVRYAEGLRRACAKEVCSAEISTSVTISIGLVVSRGQIDLSEVMRAADQALYVAKHRGRNRVARADALTGSIAA